MKSILANPESAAIVRMMLCVPITIIFLLLWRNIDPPARRLPDAPHDRPDALGSLPVIGAALLLPVRPPSTSRRSYGRFGQEAK